VRLKSVAQNREKEVQVALAETIDQLSIIVQAGLSIDAAIVRAARGGHGPLAAELTRVAHDVRAGIPRTHALLAMAERVALPELRQVVTAIVQAESLGVPMANTLQVQAEELREKRRQRAEEQALKLPVKILFPTVFCILPALFVVILGPAFMRISENLGG
jgi:tight adherence protein C